MYCKHVKEKHAPVHGNSSTVLKSVVVKHNNYYFDIQNCGNSTVWKSFGIKKKIILVEVVK
jgi:hypothetical protein